MAREIGTDHRLAGRLFSSGVHEARILASMIDDPNRVTEAQADRWARAFDSWDVCDQCCMNLFRKTRFARAKAIEWSERDEEFVKRAAFALMATLAVHDKAAPDAAFKEFLPIIEREATDERTYVRKAVNWALRQIGKRNLVLNRAAVAAARRIARIDSKAARWIAADARRELTGDAVQAKLRS
jgi:3-methyladenine DNA glycosylase AlkD